MSKRPRVVIIGAGMAGLTAANKLYTSSNNIFDLSVVEGGSRIGGRINTSEFSSEKIEMGATWIHGIGGSPVYTIAEETGSLVSDEPWECMDSTVDKARTFTEGGFEVESSIVEPISELFNALMELAQGTQNDDVLGIYENATSVGSFLKHGFEAYCDATSNRVKGSLEEAIFNMFCNTQRTYTSADDLSTLDYVAESEYQMFPGEEITIAKGYISVIHHLASGIPQGVIKLNKRVMKIEWGSNQVKLCFSDGSVVFADHVIVTVSLGVLKAGIESGGGLFSPPLPEFKAEAIKRLGYGVVNKLFVEVSQRHFPSLQLVFERDDSEFRFVKIPWWMRRTASIAPIHSNSKVLLSWFAGKEALELERLTDGEIIDGVLTTISCLTGKEVIKKGNAKKSTLLVNDDEVVTITKVLKSKWGGDPLFRGSYSYVAVGSSGDDLDAMAEPLPRVNKKGGEVKCHDQDKVHELQVMFAGEATHRTHYSTTHGAYFSGLREANRLLKHYKCDF